LELVHVGHLTKKVMTQPFEVSIPTNAHTTLINIKNQIKLKKTLCVLS